MNNPIKIRLMGEANNLQIFSALLENLVAKQIITIADSSDNYPVRGSSKEFQKDVEIKMLIEVTK